MSFQSFVQPPSVYRYDYATDHLSPYHVPDVGLDPSVYVTDQVWYSSPDGTRVSMFLVHRDDLPWDGVAECMLHFAARREHVVRTILPALEVAAIMAGVRRGLEVLFAPRPKRIDRAYHEDEMFIG